VSVGANLRVSGAQATPRSESDIRIDPGQPSRVIAASNNIAPGPQAQFFSADGGATWGQTSLPLVSGDDLHSDPTVGWTSDGTAWAVTIGLKGARLELRAYRSSDGGATWTFDATASGGQTAADKELMWVDRGPSSPFADSIYVIWHNDSPVYVNRRTGPAGAWQTPVQVSGAETTGTGIGGDVTTNQRGDVFALWPDTGSRRLLVARSTDGGASFGAPVVIATTIAAFDIGVPAFASRRALVYLSGAAHVGKVSSFVFAAWTDLSGAAGCTGPGDEPGTDTGSACKSRIWFARSLDGGVTWEAPRMLNDQASRNDQFHPRLAVDDADGTLVVAYYDTVGDPGRLRTDVWYQSSADYGATWTAAQPVTTAETDETASTADAGNQYGDYIGLSAHAGRALPSWTDRRGGGSEEIWTAPVSPETISGYAASARLQQE
jgi:hypothetical protein